MRNRYKLVVFDADGTLLDTSEGVYSSVLYTAIHFRKPLPDQSQLASFIGPPVQDSFRRIYGVDEDMAQEMANVFRLHYGNDDLFKARPYDGIYDVLDKLCDMGIQVAVATYKRTDYAREVVRHFGFNVYTANVYGADNENRLTKGDIIRLCLDRANVEAKDALMVGDSKTDALGALACGMDFAAVMYGYGFRTEEDVKDLPRLGKVYATEDILDFVKVKCGCGSTRGGTMDNNSNYKGNNTCAGDNDSNSNSNSNSNKCNKDKSSLKETIYTDPSCSCGPDCCMEHPDWTVECFNADGTPVTCSWNSRKVYKTHADMSNISQVISAKDCNTDACKATMTGCAETDCAETDCAETGCAEKNCADAGCADDTDCSRDAADGAEDKECAEGSK